MKRITTVILLLIFISSAHAQVHKPVPKVVPKTVKKPEAPVPVKVDAPVEADPITDNTPPVVNTEAVKVYNNYDFIPGDTIVFEDHFTDDQNGEFPSHWNLGAGQAVMNIVAGQHALLLTEGNYAHVSPLIKSPVFFNDAFTVECDFYVNNGYSPKFYFYDNSKDAKNASNDRGSVALSQTEVSVKVPGAEVELSANFPADLKNDTYVNNWHHLAIAYKKNQLKIYVDQFRVLVVPNLGIVPHAFDIEGIGDLNNPIVLTNFRIARGAGMNMLGKKFTDAKIVTHGINFDIGKATIRPESMGTLNMIVAILKENPEIKFEVDGHTDATGTPAHNLTLSQQRAASVKAQLTAMGVDAARLTTKGYGSSKPISDNTSLEGRANNRRVEFIKM